MSIHPDSTLFISFKTMEKPGIIIVDDHRLFRSGLKYIIDASDNYRVIAEASNGFELLEVLENTKPHLVIMDIMMPKMNGIDATRLALNKYPDLKIIILSMYGEIEYYNALMDLGIKGFMLKDADNEEFFLAVNKVLSGETYFSQELLLNVIRESTLADPVKLSRREKEILSLISTGLSNQEISAVLNISQRTVERHRTHLLEKTGSKNSIRLIIYALKNKLISI
jgi:DNA-binding NarL/FixJ family response regulator